VLKAPERVWCSRVDQENFHRSSCYDRFCTESFQEPCAAIIDSACPRRAASDPGPPEILTRSFSPRNAYDRAGHIPAACVAAQTGCVGRSIRTGAHSEAVDRRIALNQVAQPIFVEITADSLVELALARDEMSSKAADFLGQCCIRHLPANVEVCARSGELLLSQHDPAKALFAAEKALNIDPTNPQALQAKIKAQGS